MIWNFPEATRLLVCYLFEELAAVLILLTAVSGLLLATADKPLAFVPIETIDTR